MSVDIQAFISHQLDKDQLLNLPKIIDSWEQVKKLKIPNPHSNLNFQENYEQEMKKIAAWVCEQDATFANLELLWDYYHFRHGGASPVYLETNNISCFIGDISVFKNKIKISHWPEHKYANLQFPDIAKMVLGMNREIAKALQADKVLYFPDTCSPTEEIWMEAVKYKTIEEVINYAENEFGTPPRDLNAGMKNLFFVDYMESDLDELEEWNWNDVRW